MNRISELLGRARVGERMRFARRVGFGVAVALGEGAAQWSAALAAKGEAIEPAVLGPVFNGVGRVRDAVARTTGGAAGWVAGGARRAAKRLDLASSEDLSILTERLESLARALEGARETTR